MRKPTPGLFQCAGCRQRKEIVKRTCGMSYCQGCANKAPSGRQYQGYLHQNTALALRGNEGRPTKAIISNWYTA